MSDSGPEGRFDMLGLLLKQGQQLYRVYTHGHCTPLCLPYSTASTSTPRTGVAMVRMGIRVSFLTSRAVSLRVTFSHTGPASWTHVHENTLMPSPLPWTWSLRKCHLWISRAHCILLLNGFLVGFTINFWLSTPGPGLCVTYFLSAFRSDLKFMISGREVFSNTQSSTGMGPHRTPFSVWNA